MSIHEVMSQQIGKSVFWKGEWVTISEVLNIYDGDFYCYQKDGLRHMINIWTEEGHAFEQAIKESE